MKASKIISIIGGVLIGSCAYMWCCASGAAGRVEGQMDVVNAFKDALRECEKSIVQEEIPNEEVEG